MAGDEAMTFLLKCEDGDGTYPLVTCSGTCPRCRQDIAFYSSTELDKIVVQNIDFLTGTARKEGYAQAMADVVDWLRDGCDGIFAEWYKRRLESGEDKK